MTENIQQAADLSRSLLLQQLIPDYEGKQNCRECLRSKANPSPAVASVLQNHQELLTVPSILQAQEQLISDHLPLLKTSVSTSIEGFTRLGTMFQFLQLLLLVPKDKLPPEQVPPIAVRLIQCMTKELSTVPLLEDEDDDDEKEEMDLLTADACTTTLERRQLVCFAFPNLLRLNNHYAKTQINLIAPLWRGICDLHKLSTVPQPMVEDAIQQLLHIVQDGSRRLLNRIISAENFPTNESNFAIEGKFISFLVMRLSNLLAPTNGSTKLRTKSYKTMLSLQGLDLIDNEYAKYSQGERSSPAVKTTCQMIAVKAEKALIATIVANNCSIQRNELDCLVHLSIPRPDQTMTPAIASKLSHNAFYLAKARILLALLQHPAAKHPTNLADNIDAPLVVCESLHSVALPQCYAALTMACWQQDSELMNQFMGESVRLLARTLVQIEVQWSRMKRRQLHRLLVRWMTPNKTEEMHPISREVTLSSIYLFLREVDSTSLHDFLTLVVKLFFDPRTRSALRRNLSSLLTLTLCSQSTSQIELRTTARDIVEAEAANIVNVESKKRKRTPSSCSSRRYDFEDVHAISTALMHVPMSCEQLLQATKNCCQRVVQGGTFSRKEDIRTPRLAKAESTCLVLALMQGTFLNNTTVDSFQAKTGVRLVELQQALIQSISALPTDQEDVSIRRHALLCSSMLRFCTKACTLEQKGLVPIEDICGLLSFCTGKAFLPGSDGVGKNNVKHNQYRSTVLFAAIGLLRSIGIAIPPNCPQYILQDDSRHMIAINTSAALLESLCHPRDYGKNIFPTATTMEVAAGSYFLQMETQEGRQALVIFPPGSQSIKDIKYMKGLELEDDVDDGIQTLKRTIVAGNGGCRFLLKSY
eukprot:scaffold3399_cov117-Cylindrotheca_fusiformis.AAC.5